MRGMRGSGCVHGRGCMYDRGGVRGRRDSHCSGRYASYWNAFLLSMSLVNVSLMARKM